MLTQLLDLDMVSNNLANVNTNAYKSNRSNFQELLSAEYKNGVQLRTTQMIMSQGSLTTSDDDFDIAVDGRGYFAVTLPDGRIAYTRDGDFMQDSEGTIVNAAPPAALARNALRDAPSFRRPMSLPFLLL